MFLSLWVFVMMMVFLDYQYYYNEISYLFLVSDLFLLIGFYGNMFNVILLSYDYVYISWILVEMVVFVIWLIIFMVFIVGGNFMVIVVVWRYRGMWIRINMFIVNLVIVDFLIGILLVFIFLIMLILYDWILGDEMCFLNSFLNVVCFLIFF